MFGEGGFLDVREESCGVESGGGVPATSPDYYRYVKFSS